MSECGNPSITSMGTSFRDSGSNTSSSSSSMAEISPLIEEAVASSSQDRLGPMRVNSNFQAVRIRPLAPPQRITREQRLQDILTAVLDERVNRGKNYYFLRYVCDSMKDFSDEDEADDFRYQVHKALHEAKVRRRNRKMRQQPRQQQQQQQPLEQQQQSS